MPTTGGTPFNSRVNFAGNALVHDERMQADTGTHIIKFSRREGDRFVPDVRTEPKIFTDPEPRERVSGILGRDVAGMSTSAAFSVLFEKDLEAQRPYLIPDFKTLMASLPKTDQNKSAYLQVSGRRIERFIDEWSALISKSAIESPGEFSKSLWALNTTSRDLFADRVIEFPTADTRTYWSCSKDQVFVHIYEALLKHLPVDSPKRVFLQGQVDHLLTYKYTPEGYVDPKDVERCLGLSAIDQASRHIVSMTLDTENTFSLKYETLQVPSTNRTGHSGKFVYRDGRNYFLEGTRTRIPPNVIRTLMHREVEKVVLARPKSMEQIRGNFKFDWSENGDFSRVETGWWGFCDGRASAEQKQVDMRRSGGMIESHPKTGSTVVFDRDLQMEAYASVMDFASQMVDSRGISKRYLGANLTKGERFYGTPDNFAIQPEFGDLVEIPVTIKAVSQKNRPGKADNVETLFMEKIPRADKEGFDVNPEAVVGYDGVTNYISTSNRKLVFEYTKHGKKGVTFDGSGALVPLTGKVSLDPTAKSADAVLLGTHLVDADKKELLKYEYHPDTKKLSKSWVAYRLEGREYKPQVLRTEGLGALMGSEIGRERKRDDHAMAKLDALMDAIRTGEKINVDSTWWKAEVWNGQATRFYIHTEFRDQTKGFERVGVYMDARFAEGDEPGTYGRVGSYINKLDKDGNITESLEDEPFCDFLWRTGERITPFLGSGRSRVYNKEMVERGMLDPIDGPSVAVDAMWDLCDVMFLGLNEKTGKPLYSIPVEGPHYVNGALVRESGRVIYRDRATWEADLASYRAELAGFHRAQAGRRFRTAAHVVTASHPPTPRGGRAAQPYPYNLGGRSSSHAVLETTRGARASTASSRARRHSRASLRGASAAPAGGAGRASSVTGGLGFSISRVDLHERN